MNIFKLFMGIVAATVTFTACSDKTTIEENEFTEPPMPITPTKPDLSNKVIAMSIDSEANFEYLASKANIDKELNKIKDYGFNTIYLDVKPAVGRAMYKSEILEPCNKFGAKVVERDYDDYLGYFIEKGKELGIDIVANIFSCCWGYKSGNAIRDGLIYENLNEWRNEIQVRNHHGSTKLVSNLDDNYNTLIFLSPASHKFQTLILNVVGEIATKYPDLKGINIDYLRYAECEEGWFGMGDVDLEAYSQYWNEPKPDPTEIITLSGEDGPKFKKWIEFRSATVKSVLEKIRSRIKSANPNCELHMWSSADWPSRYIVGQNWGSMKYTPTGYQYSNTYSQTGCAHLLDTFVLGAYASQVWEHEDPSVTWCFEKFCKQWDIYTKKESKCIVAVPVYAYLDNPQKLTDATYLGLRYADGIREFELSHVNRGNMWDAIVKGFERYTGQSN